MKLPPLWNFYFDSPPGLNLLGDKLPSRRQAEDGVKSRPRRALLRGAVRVVDEGFSSYQSKRKPSCSRREFPLMLVMVPAAAEARLEIGRPKLGWLNRLNISARSWNFLLSVTGKFFWSERSKSVKLGPLSELRPTFPMLPGPGGVNRATLKAGFVGSL